jgi:hypothetical protein
MVAEDTHFAASFLSNFIKLEVCFDIFASCERILDVYVPNKWKFSARVCMISVN